MEGSSPFTCTPFPNDTPPNNPPVQVGGPSQTKPRNKLGADGRAILEAYLLRISNPLQPPPLSDRKELTSRIKELPGCGYWSEKHTCDWFQRRRKKLQNDIALSSLPSKLVTPSKDALQHLGVLLNSQPNPSSDVIRTWAALLAREGGSVAVELWIGYITQVVRASTDCALRPSANLPTPAGTVTPEPLMSPSGSSNQSLPPKMKYDPADSPILAPLAIRTLPTAASSLSPSAAEVESLLIAGQTQRPVTSLRAIIEDVVQASQNPIVQIHPLPNDADEFVTMFAPYEAKLTKLLHILESEH